MIRVGFLARPLDRRVKQPACPVSIGLEVDDVGIGDLTLSSIPVQIQEE